MNKPFEGENIASYIEGWDKIVQSEMICSLHIFADPLPYHREIKQVYMY